MRFWLQHSDRATFDVNEGWIKDVGRWAQPTSHEYVRTHLQRVRSIQRRVAVNARLPCGAPGAFDEEEVHADLSDFLLRDGVGSEEVVEQVLAFTLALARARAAMQPTEPHTVAPCPNNDQQYVIPSNSVAHGSDESSAGSDHAAPVGSLFITEQQRSGFKTLHRLNGCSTRPQDCYSARLVGEDIPDASEFDAKCRHCFRDELSCVTTSSSGSSSDA